MPEFDQFVLAALVLVIVFGGMRFFYGAWPWEASKTWYRTRETALYVEALRAEKNCNSTQRQIGETVETARVVSLKDFRVSLRKVEPRSLSQPG